MPRITVHLLRHGEVYNPAGVLYGRLPEFHLSDLGREMADVAAGFFADRAAAGARIVHLVSSPLTRAQETAAPTSAALGLEVATDERIIEAANHFEGLRVNRAELMRPAHWPYFVNPFRPSWGEPYKAQAARVLEAAQDARRQALATGGEGAEAILVSHQLPIWVARRAAERKPLWHDPRKRECTLTSVTSLVFEDERIVSVGYSEPAAALLPGASATPGA